MNPIIRIGAIFALLLVLSLVAEENRLYADIEGSLSTSNSLFTDNDSENQFDLFQPDFFAHSLFETTNLDCFSCSIHFNKIQLHPLFNQQITFIRAPPQATEYS